MDKEALYYNALAMAFLGDRLKLAKIRRKTGTWEQAYRMLRKTALHPQDPGEVWAALERANIRFIFAGAPEYPALLREIKDPPIGLYIRGKLPAKTASYFAGAGTRRATPEGVAHMRRFTGVLARNGFVVVSGLAFGIDAAAHEGCLDEGGITVAVLAGGLHDVYPRENAKLADRILENGGALVSEYPMGTPPYADRFLERNRIIAGISRGVLIIEAPEKSGALVTARLAMEENRDVFALPGSISHRNSIGPHWLIRQGAELVTSPEEILEACGIAPEAQRASAFTAASSEEKQVLKALRDARAPLDVDKISAAAKLEPRIANRVLALLVLKNVVREEGGGYTI